MMMKPVTSLINLLLQVHMFLQDPRNMYLGISKVWLAFYLLYLPKAIFNTEKKNNQAWMWYNI